MTEAVATSGDTPKTNTLTYRGDVTNSLKSVVGGRAMVISKTYDAEANVTRVEVAQLIDPMALLEGRR